MNITQSDKVVNEVESMSGISEKVVEQKEEWRESWQKIGVEWGGSAGGGGSRQASADVKKKRGVQEDEKR